MRSGVGWGDVYTRLHYGEDHKVVNTLEVYWLMVLTAGECIDIRT